MIRLNQEHGALPSRSKNLSNGKGERPKGRTIGAVPDSMIVPEVLNPIAIACKTATGDCLDMARQLHMYRLSCERRATEKPGWQICALAFWLSEPG